MSKYFVNFVHIHEYHYCESADCIVGGAYNEEVSRRGTKGRAELSHFDSKALN